MARRINWTDEMLNELLEITNITQFARKWGMSYNSASNKRDILLTENKKEVEIINKNEKINLEKQLEDVNATQISIVPSIILNIDSLMEKGTKSYLSETMNNISTLDKSISDIEHILEERYESLSEKDSSTLAKNIGMLRVKRRMYKNEYDFLNNNRVNCDIFIKFIKDIKEYSNKVCDSRYNTRVLKSELGRVRVVSENNSELVKLREQVKQLEHENNVLRGISNSITDGDTYVNRILRLEKFRIKQERKNKREQGKPVWCDNLVSNWKQMFEDLDGETKSSILNEVYTKYREGNALHDKEIMDYIVWNDMLPNTLFSKGYFLRNKEEL